MIDPGVQIAGLVVAAVGANWLADRLRIPSILPLLAIGVLVGPVLGWLDPDELLGDALIPAVALAVGIILYEGGLSLRIREIEGSQRAITGLVSVGVLVTWVMAGTAAWAFTDLGLGPAVVLGAILVVSGPTVVGPVLQSVRPSRRVASILKWESIFIDPIGAMVAVIAFDIVLEGQGGPGMLEVVGQVLLFLADGVVVGLVVAFGAIQALRRHWVPEHILSLFGVAAALIAYTAAEAVFHESGLLATTVVGLVLANHRRVRTEPLLRFSEILRVLLIGLLFIVLSARLTREQLTSIGWGAAILVVVLVVIARPAAVWLSTARSSLSREEKSLLAGVAPRGIVAASIASVFGLELEEAGIAGGELLTPIAFAVIVATVLIYGLGAGPLARRLGLARATQEGVLVVGAGPVERALASAIHDAGIDVVVATVNRNDERQVRMSGLRTFYGNVLDEDVDLRLEMSGIGRLMAVTPNDEVNTLAARRFIEVFGGAETFQLAAAPPPAGVEGTPVDLGGRELFGHDWTYQRLRDVLDRGGIRRTALTDTYGREDFLAECGEDSVMLAAVREGRLLVSVADAPTPLRQRLQPGDVVLWLDASAGSAEARS